MKATIVFEVNEKSTIVTAVGTSCDSQVTDITGTEIEKDFVKFLKKLRLHQKGQTLVHLIDPEKFYEVSYIIKQDGTKVFKQTKLLGKDLTKPQINEVFLDGQC